MGLLDYSILLGYTPENQLQLDADVEAANTDEEHQKLMVRGRVVCNCWLNLCVSGTGRFDGAERPERPTREVARDRRPTTSAQSD